MINGDTQSLDSAAGKNMAGYPVSPDTPRLQSPTTIADGFLKIPRLERSWERRYFRRVKITILETAPVVKLHRASSLYNFLIRIF